MKRNRREDRLLLPVNTTRRHPQTREQSLARPFLEPQERKKLLTIRQQMLQIEQEKIAVKTVRRLAYTLGLNENISQRIFRKPPNLLNPEELKHICRIMLNHRSHAIWSNSPYWIKAWSKEEVERARIGEDILNRIAVPHEKIVGVFPTEQTNFVLFEKAGKSIDLNFFDEKIRRNFYPPMKNIDELIEGIAKMHIAGMTHNHLHSGNIAILNGHTVILDLKETRIYRIRWESPTTVFELLGKDLNEIRKFLYEDTSLTDWEAKEKFIGLLNRYPMTESNRRLLLNEIRLIMATERWE